MQHRQQKPHRPYNDLSSFSDDKIHDVTQQWRNRKANLPTDRFSRTEKSVLHFLCRNTIYLTCRKKHTRRKNACKKEWPHPATWNTFNVPWIIFKIQHNEQINIDERTWAELFLRKICSVCCSTRCGSRASVRAEQSKCATSGFPPFRCGSSRPRASPARRLRYSQGPWSMPREQVISFSFFFENKLKKINKYYKNKVGEELILLSQCDRPWNN